MAVLFGHRSNLSDSAPANSILIVPSGGSWNDFSYKSRVIVRISAPNGDFDTEAFLGFMPEGEDELNGVHRLEKLLGRADTKWVPANASARFFTMLPEMKHYRAIVERFGPTKATGLLSSIRDLVAARENATSMRFVRDAERTKIFARSFMRNAESYFAYNNAGSILKGLDQERFRQLSSGISIRFQLAGRKNEHDLTFRFDHEADLPKRIAIVIGKNGVGKSQTLARIAKAALSDTSVLTDADSGNRVLVNRLLAFAPTNEANSVFPSDRLKRPKVWYRRFALNRGATRARATVADVIVQVARSTEGIGRLSRWEIFQSALGAIDNSSQICLQRQGGLGWVPLSSLHRGSEQMLLDTFAAVDSRADPMRVVDQELFPLSSGEMSFLRFAAYASLHIENGSLLLLDEPETHLHPNFISQFVALLDKLLQATGSACIIATHSVYFVREVFQDQVVVLRQDPSGFVQAQTPSLRTFGADVGAISYFVFDEDEPSKLEKSVERGLVSSFPDWNSLFETYKNELSLEMLGELREAMEREGKS